MTIKTFIHVEKEISVDHRYFKYAGYFYNIENESTYIEVNPRSKDFCIRTYEAQSVVELIVTQGEKISKEDFLTALHRAHDLINLEILKQEREVFEEVFNRNEVLNRSLNVLI